MVDSHQTEICPWCGKDSYASGWAAIFAPQKCTWCNCTFSTINGEMVVVTPGKEGDKQ